VADFLLIASGLAYGGWTELSVTRSLEQLAHSFVVQLTDKWAGQGQPIPIRMGDPVVVAYKNDAEIQKNLITGWVDKDAKHYDATNRTLSIIGRSRTCDLIDCAAIRVPGHWRNAPLNQIAQDLCLPFGIAVHVQAPIGEPFKWFAITVGETVFETLERACRQRGVVMGCDGLGDLVLQRSGQLRIRTVLEWGKNILECDQENSMEERFSQYTVTGQSSGGGLLGDNFSGKVLSQSAPSLDTNVTRYRPTIIHEESKESGVSKIDRANWERNVRAGRSERVTYKVDGWEHADGLWEPNTLVHVTDPECEIDEDLLVVTATYTRSNEDGSHTSLELTLPEAYTVQPLKPPIKKGRGGLLG
jgi:prophage tail gpP-like protein